MSRKVGGALGVAVLFWAFAVCADDVNRESAAELFVRADAQAALSAQWLKEANQIRSALQSQAPDSEQRKAKMAQSAVLQAKGVEARQTAASIRASATQKLQAQVITDWSQWLHRPGRFHLASDRDLSRRAHNISERSVHPKKIDLLESPEPERVENMSLSVSGTQQQQLPGELNLSTFALSRQRRYFAHIEYDPITASKLGNAIPLQTMHNWTLILTDLDGEAVRPDHIEFKGHMPGHVHGLPTQPQVSERLRPSSSALGATEGGLYQVEGVKFQMSGWWVIEFHITDAIGTDSVRFNLQL